MLISLCIIVKNDEETIGKCIGSVRDIVDEIIVIDTGSEDSTIKIAKSMKAKIYNFKWIDDFSAARNFAISKASGNWIIFLDSDEYIDSNQSSLLKESIYKADRNESNIILTGLVNINSTNGNFLSSTKTIRIFKSNSILEYRGRIHEALYSSSGTLKPYDISELISIFHTGYTPEVIKDKNKAKRNLKILHQELDLNPNNVELYFYLGESLMIDSQFSKAIPYFEKAIKLDNGEISGLIHRCYSNILTCMFEEKKDISEFYSVYNEAIHFDQNYPDFDFFLGLRELELEQYVKSMEFFYDCLNKIERYNYDFESRIVTKVLFIYRTLITLNIIIENTSEVVRLAVYVLKVEKYDYNTLCILADILLKNEQLNNVFNFLLKLYDKNLIKDKLYLIKVAEFVNEKSFYDKALNLLSEEEKNSYYNNKLISNI